MRSSRSFPPRDALPDNTFARPGSTTQRHVDRLRAAIVEEERAARRVMDSPVAGPRQQQLSLSDARDEAHRLQNKIAMDEARGSLRHHTVSRLAKTVSLVFLGVIDLPIMLWLASSVFNVDWSDPLGLRLMISIVVALLGTAGSAWVLYHIGHNRREDKTDQRRLDWRRLWPGRGRACWRWGAGHPAGGGDVHAGVQRGVAAERDGRAHRAAGGTGRVRHAVCRRHWCSSPRCGTGRSSRTTWPTTARWCRPVWNAAGPTRIAPTGSGPSWTCSSVAPVRRRSSRTRRTGLSCGAAASRSGPMTGCVPPARRRPVRDRGGGAMSDDKVSVLPRPPPRTPRDRRTGGSSPLRGQVCAARNAFRSGVGLFSVELDRRHADPAEPSGRTPTPAPWGDLSRRVRHRRAEGACAELSRAADRSSR